MRHLLVGSVLALAAVVAHAQAPAVYVGAGVSRATLDDIFDQAGHHIDLDNTAWKAFVGVRPIRPIGVEADYMDLGSESQNFGFGSGVHADAKAFAAYAVGFLPLPVPFLDVYGKVGAARWQLRGHAEPSLFALDDNGTNFAWGAGAQAHFGPVAVRLEYEQFDVRNTDGVKAVTAGVSFNFL
ncbi:MAG TPA: outer membrane beta-barrel protein [Steroidobacteraceae bacterium]|nr:outer membrane beta-barrel protein [Steroidobacteraceae bacterium]